MTIDKNIAWGIFELNNVQNKYVVCILYIPTSLQIIIIKKSNLRNTHETWKFCISVIIISERIVDIEWKHMCEITGKTKIFCAVADSQQFLLFLKFLLKLAAS